MATRQRSGDRGRSSGTRRKKGGSGRLGPILLYGVLAAELVGAVLFAVLYTRKRSDRVDGTPRGNLLRYMPDGMKHIKTMAVAQILANPDYLQLRTFASVGEVEATSDLRTIPLSNIERITTGGSQDGTTTVFHLKEPIQALELRQRITPTVVAASWSEEKEGDNTIHILKTNFRVQVEGVETTSPGNPDSFFMPDNKTVVFGVPRDLQSVARRKGGPKNGPGMEKALAVADFDKPFVNAIDGTDNDVVIFGDKPLTVDVRIFLRRSVLAAKVGHTEFSGGGVTTTTTFLANDPEGAQYVKTTIEEGRNRAIAPHGTEARDLFANQTFTITGNTLTVRNTQTLAALAAWYKTPRKRLDAEE